MAEPLEAPRKVERIDVSGDSSPIIIDDGGSLRVKQRNQQLMFDNNGVATVAYQLQSFAVTTIKFDGTSATFPYAAQDFRVNSGDGFVEVGNGDTFTSLTFSKGKPTDKHDDANKPRQYKHVGKDHGDVFKLTDLRGNAINPTAGPAPVFDDSVNYTMVRLLFA